MVELAEKFLFFKIRQLFGKCNTLPFKNILFCIIVLDNIFTVL